MDTNSAGRATGTSCCIQQNHHRPHAIAVLLACALIVVTAVVPAFGEDEKMEEVVVTGSLIKRDNFDLASPVEVIDQFEIEAAASPEIGEVIYNLPQSLGVLTTANSLESSNAYFQGSMVFADLRGLGSGATMEMMDGRRLIFGDANNNYPQIALKRIEMLMDGASTLYGSEAVAGVVNYIPYKQFDGMQIVADYRSVLDASDAKDFRLGFIGGTSNDRSNMVAALEVRRADPIWQTDFPERLRRPFELNKERYPYYYNGIVSSANPGTFYVPRRRATNASIARYSTTPDPGCENSFEDGGDDPADRGSFRNGIRIASPIFGNRCIGWMGADAGVYRSDLDNMNGYVHYDYRFNDSLTVEFEGIYNRHITSTPTMVAPTTLSRLPTSNNLLTLAPDNPNWDYVVPSELPGNPYRAHTEANVFGDGLYNAGTDTLIYARDLNGDGYPDRDIDLDGNPATYTAAEAAAAFMNPRYPIILAANPFDAASGVPFAEDVSLLAMWSPYTKGLLGQPAQVNRAGIGERRNLEENWRYSVGATYDFPSTNWELRAFYTWGVRNENRKNALGAKQAIRSAIIDGIHCRAGGDRNLCFNPFSSAQFKFVDGVPQAVAQDEDLDGTGPGNNGLELNAIFSDEYSENINEMTLFDFVAAGDLPVSLPGGNIGLALGTHYRLEQEEHIPDSATATDDRLFGTGYKKRETEQESNDYFGEVILPVMESRFGNLELQLAARRTSTDSKAIVPASSGSGSYSKTLVKYAGVYQFHDWLSLRASYGEGFVIPDQFTAFGDVRTSVGTNDYTCDVLEDANGVPLLAAECGSVAYPTTTLPSPGLSAETSELVNVGFTLKFLEGALTLQADYAKVDFEDQVDTLTITQQGDILEPGFRKALDAAGCPPTADPGTALACWQAARLAYITTVEAAKNTSNYGFERDAGGNITHGLISAINTGGNHVETLDVTVAYTLPWDAWGTWKVRLNGTNVREWEGRVLRIDPYVDCVGTGGEGCPGGAFPTPDWKINAVVTWLYGNHVARLTARYHSPVEAVNVVSGVCSDARDYPHPNPNVCFEHPASTYVDGFYQYSLNGIFGNMRDMTVAVGIQNMFNHQPPVIGQSGGVDNYLESPLGRVVTLRVSQTL